MRRPGRRRKVDAALPVVWMVVWTAAIIVAVAMLGRAAFAGEPAATVFLAVWVAAALFGLHSAGRNLVRLLVTGRPRRPDTRWDDGMDPPAGG